MRSHMTFLMRLHRIDQLIQEAGVISFEKLVEALKCSAPTLKRDLRYMREDLGAPIVYSHAKRGYYYSHDSKLASKKLQNFKNIPASWYSADELQVFMSLLQMLDRVQSDQDGLLAEDMLPLRARLLALIRLDKISARDLLKRVKVILPEHRRVQLPHFGTIGVALSQRRRLRMVYYTQGRGAETLREVSPMRLVNYRNRWYMEAWCHQSEQLRTFSVENVLNAELTDKRCRVVAMREVQERFDSTYGIYSGQAQDKQTAVIEIDAVMTPFVRNEIWHRDQTIVEHDNGAMTLTVPFAREVELASRILGLGSHARVSSPQSLQEYVRQQAQATAAMYADTTGGAS